MSIVGVSLGNGAKTRTHVICLCRDTVPFELGGGGYLSTFDGTGTCHFQEYFFQTVMGLWVSFSQFLDIERNYGCPFQGILHHYQNYGPDFPSICGIMALKPTRIYGIMGTSFCGKWHGPVR